MKRTSKLLTLSLLSLSCLALPLTACDSFTGGNGLAIADIVTGKTENGDTLVVITFEDDANPPISFVIPSGEDGVGIDKVEGSVVNDVLTIVIYYTDSNKPVTTISVPIQPGRGIKEVDVDHNISGDVIITFVYTDNTTSGEIVIPKGVDGVGIDSINTETVDGVTTVTITYSDPNIPPEVFKINDGKSIKSVEYSSSLSDDENYVLIITYSDDSTSKISFPRPKSTQWYTGTNPPSVAVGKPGDFYLDKVTGNVYEKDNNGNWIYVFCMKGSGSAVSYDVTFNLNGGHWANGSTNDKTYLVDYADYVNLTGVGIPEYEGYDFAGWWTSPDASNPNAGHLTDLTPIFKDMVLYARWSN